MAETPLSFVPVLASLKERYFSSAAPEENAATLLLRCRDLPVLAAWQADPELCKIPLKTLLEREGLLPGKKAEEASSGIAEETPSGIAEEAQPLLPKEPEAPPQPLPLPAESAEEELSPAPEPLQVFPEEAIRASLQEYGTAFLEKMGRDLSRSYAFMRTLKVREMDRFLLASAGITYFERLLREGVLRPEDASLWLEPLLAALPPAEGGRIRVSALLYEKDRPLSSVAARERYAGQMELRPVYRPGGYTLDTALFSAGAELGALSRTRCRTQGLGVLLAPVLLTGGAAAEDLRFADGEDALLLFDLKLTPQVQKG